MGVNNSELGILWYEYLYLCKRLENIEKGVEAVLLVILKGYER